MPHQVGTQYAGSPGMMATGGEQNRKPGGPSIMSLLGGVASLMGSSDPKMAQLAQILNGGKGPQNPYGPGGLPPGIAGPAGDGPQAPMDPETMEKEQRRKMLRGQAQDDPFATTQPMALNPQAMMAALAMMNPGGGFAGPSGGGPHGIGTGTLGGGGAAVVPGQQDNGPQYLQALAQLAPFLL